MDDMGHARTGQLVEGLDGRSELRGRGSAGRARLHVLPEAPLLDRRELVLVGRGEEVVEMAARAHAFSSAKPGAAAVPRRALASIERARLSRDLTVPIGTRRAADISS